MGKQQQRRGEDQSVGWQRGTKKVEMTETDTKDGENKGGRRWFIKTKWRPGERVTARDVKHSRHSGGAAGLLQYERRHINNEAGITIK